MKLVLVRHGRTFAPGATAVWIGAQEDPALTREGVAEAQALGTALAPFGAQLCRIDSSPMARTQEHARAVLAAAGIDLPLRDAQALRELHYGSWAGRARADIVAAGGGPALEAWEARATYPVGVGFAPARDEVLGALQQWLQQVRQEVARTEGGWALAVTHGGVLRLLAHAWHAEGLASGSVPGKVACGHGCVVDITCDRPTVLGWNLPPAALVQHELCALAGGRIL